MKKEISHEEKIEFYHKYNDKEFQKSLQTTEDKYAKVGFILLEIFLTLSVIGGFLTLWLWLSIIPAITCPLTTMAISHNKNKKRIDALTKNMTYKTFVKMFDNGEWENIVKELNDEVPRSQNETDHHVSIVEELKNHDCSYFDSDKTLENNHDDLSL